VTHRTLVSTATLAEHLAVSAVVDCRFDLQREDWGHDQYLTAHIPNAVYAHLTRDLSGEKTGTNGRHPLPPADRLAKTFGQMGIDRRIQVVVYDQDSGMFASRLWWMLRYLGHDAVAVLDGGLAKWTREGRPTHSGDESRSVTHFDCKPQPDLVIGLPDVQAARDLLLVDARAPERFEGRSEPLDRVAGHIPGAVNHFFKGNMTPDGVMLPVDVLRERLTRVLGTHPPDRTVMYCGSGVTACHNLLAMEHAGLRGARLYPGSWSEWSADPARPVETGT
jgi:thiosulfate/3-mercaptopyruvate sulfurtransferase